MNISYIWIKKYKNIENQHFNFDNKWNFHFDINTGRLNVEEKEDDSNLFENDNLNITAIVGKNGSGSSLIEALVSDNSIEKLIVVGKTIIIYPLSDFKFIDSDFPLKINLRDLFSKNIETFDAKTDEFENIIKNSSDKIAAIGFGNDYNVEIDCDNDLKENIDENHEVFKINDIYAKHGDIISEIFRKKDAWNETYFESLRNSFKEFNISNKDMYRLIFGNYYDEDEFSKRTFLKLTRDLTEDIFDF
ncbi:MAG: hypothetical protein JXR53_07875 [Bacteroidales bacterium]|nr:hypothetical protein [Bacteroidales bacterium]